MNRDAMGRLSVAEEIARERVAIMAVHKEMSEADEANLLEEEDMHIFEQEPLLDRFALVSCNSCKKPIKASQYAAHAERCRFPVLEDGSFEGKPGRKLRNGDADVSMSEDSAAADETPLLGGYPSSKPGRRFTNGSEGPKLGRPRKVAVSNPKDIDTEDYIGAGPSSEGLYSSAKRKKTFVPFSVDDLDTMCGVPSPRSGAPCRQPLTCKSHSISSKRSVVGRRKPFDILLQELKDNMSRKALQAEIPKPVASKIYTSRRNQRMRAVVSNLYHESLARPGSSSQQIDQQQQQQQQQQQLDDQLKYKVRCDIKAPAAGLNATKTGCAVSAIECCASYVR